MTPASPSRRRALPWMLTAFLAVALAGCSSKPAAAPSRSQSSPTASPTPATDRGREACNGTAKIGNSFDFDVTRNLTFARGAAQSSNPTVAEAGRTFADALQGATEPPGPSLNLKVSQLQLDFLNACGRAYGANGPW